MTEGLSGSRPSSLRVQIHFEKTAGVGAGRVREGLMTEGLEVSSDKIGYSLRIIFLKGLGKLHQGHCNACFYVESIMGTFSLTEN